MSTGVIMVGGAWSASTTGCTFVSRAWSPEEDEPSLMDHSSASTDAEYHSASKGVPLCTTFLLRSHSAVSFHCWGWGPSFNRCLSVYSALPQEGCWPGPPGFAKSILNALQGQLLSCCPFRWSRTVYIHEMGLGVLSTQLSSGGSESKAQHLNLRGSEQWWKQWNIPQTDWVLSETFSSSHRSSLRSSTVSTAKNKTSRP